MLSPALARWMTDTCDGIAAFSLERLDLRHAKDGPIREAALGAEAVMLTKDSDYTEAVRRDPSQPSVLWVRVGNTSTPAMRHLLSVGLASALDAIRRGARVVELHESGV